MKRGRKIKCIESPCKKLINGVFVFKDIIDKEKVHRKMKQSTREGNSNNAPEWFKSYVDTQEKFNKQLNERLDKRDTEDALYKKEQNKKEDERWAKQEKFNENILVRLDKIEKDVNNIVKKNKLKR